jgi:hypothetical protein
MGNGSVYNSTYVRVNNMFITRHLQYKNVCCTARVNIKVNVRVLDVNWVTLRVRFRVIVKHNVKVVVRLKTETTAGSLSCPDQTIFQGKFHG